MTVKLNISEDAELRAAIKDAIKGQVISIVRETVTDVLKEVLESKVSKISIESLLFEEMGKIIKRTLTDSPSWNQPNFIQAEAKKIINQKLEEYFKNNKPL